MTKLYIGSNNKTKKLELSKIRKILDKNIEGYTIILSHGIWKGSREKSCIIEILEDIKDNLIEELKRELKQDAILVTKEDIQSIFM